MRVTKISRSVVAATVSALCLVSLDVTPAEAGVREEGRQRYYALDAAGLREVHEWTGGFERFWSESFERLEAYVKELQRTEDDDAEG